MVETLINFRKVFPQNLAWKSLRLLNNSDRFRLVWITLIQVGLGFFDLAGVVVIGALGALLIQGVESRAAGNKVAFILRFLHLQSFPFQTQVTCLGIIAAVILIFKTILSIFFTRKIFFFLSHKGAEISANLISKTLTLNIIELQKRSSQEILYIVGEGVKNLTLGILATSISIASDLSLLLIIGTGLFAVDASLALATIMLFIMVGVILHKLLQVRARSLGVLSNNLAVANNQKIIEVLGSYRELIVRNRRKFYADEIRSLRHKLGDVTAEISFLPYTSKYVVESTTVVGALALAAYEFGTKNAVHAVATLAVFMAASSRIAPAALRIQQGILTIKSSEGSAESTFSLLEELAEISDVPEYEAPINFLHSSFDPIIELKNVTFRYPGNDKFMLRNLDLYVSAGSSLAIVGPSGSGKSTLVDLILGVLQPTSGTILLSNMSPRSAIRESTGAISYVPQDILISSGSIKENVSLGYPLESVSTEQVIKALEMAQLADLIRDLPEGINTLVGESGNKFSGGQRQRLGIARALYTNPKLLVLDEATSALDGQTEEELSNALKIIAGGATVVIIAHRLSTIKNVDQVIYLRGGEIVAQGSLEKVRSEVPEFATELERAGM